MNINAYPTLLLFREGVRIEEYFRVFQVADIEKYVHEKINYYKTSYSKSIKAINTKEFGEVIAKGRWFIVFYTGWFVLFLVSILMVLLIQV